MFKNTLFTAFLHKAAPSVTTIWCFFSDLSSLLVVTTHCTASCYVRFSFRILIACAATFILSFGMPQMVQSH